MRNTDFAAIIVVYNQACSQSPTCQRLSALTDTAPQILIYDNSTRDFGNREFCREAGWVYLGGEGNMGLSKAYNACIDYLKNQGFAGIVCLFDDDSSVTEDYFRTLKKAAEGDGLVFVPLIYAQGRLLSPCRITPSHKATLFADKETALTYAGADISAINSGMAMDMAIFEDYRYDENIFLDGIDHNHLQRLAEKQIRPTVMDIRFDHQFSGDEKPSRDSAVIRFRLFARDYAYIFRKHKSRYWFLVGKRALKLTAQYRSFIFMKIFISSRKPFALKTQ